MTTKLTERPRMTYLPSATPVEYKPVKRALRALRLDDVFDILGALLSSWSLTWLLFGWLTGLQSAVGFVVVNFMLFLLIYGVITSIKNRTEEIRDRIISVMLFSAGLILVSALLLARLQRQKI